MRSGPSARATSWIRRRQRKRIGGPSGTSATASTGWGGSKSWSGRAGGSSGSGADQLRSGSGAAADALQRCRQDFVHASLADVAGDRTAALSEFKALLPVLKGQRMRYRMIDYAQAAIARQSR